MKIISALRLLCVVGAAVHAMPINDDRPPSDDVAPSSAGRIPATMNLPSNATAIRADITDTFSCDGKIYGYYADVDNECQIFHICLPVTYADGKENMFRWSFVCPDETIFSQELFTCIRPADWTSDCSESARFVDLNRQFGSPAEHAASAAVRTSQTSDSAAHDGSQHEVVAAVSASEVAVTDVGADVRPDESTIAVKVYVESEAPYGASASDENLPVYDAETSETQSFGLFKVVDGNEIEFTSVDQADPTDADDVSQVFRAENSLGAAVSASDEPHTSLGVSSGDDVTAEPSENVTDVAANVPSATEINAAGIVEPDSTELWNQYTQSLYDGGSTIDDNVEVNAIADDDIDVTTEPSATR